MCKLKSLNNILCLNRDSFDLNHRILINDFTLPPFQPIGLQHFNPALNRWLCWRFEAYFEIEFINHLLKSLNNGTHLRRNIDQIQAIQVLGHDDSKM